MAHVGDVHAEQHPAVLGVLDADRVVEVARVDGVDREGVAVADVSAVGLAGQRLLDIDAQLRGLGGDRLGELRAQAVLADGDLDLDARVALSAHDLLDVALRRMVARRIAGEPRHDDVAGLRVADRVGGDEDVVADAAVGGRDDADGAGLVEAADDGRVRALDDARDDTRAALFAAMRVRADRDGVAVHRAGDVASGDEVVALRRRDEPVSASRHRDAPDDEPAAPGLGGALRLAHAHLL